MCCNSWTPALSSSPLTTSLERASAFLLRDPGRYLTVKVYDCNFIAHLSKRAFLKGCSSLKKRQGMVVSHYHKVCWPQVRSEMEDPIYDGQAFQFGHRVLLLPILQTSGPEGNRQLLPFHDDTQHSSESHSVCNKNSSDRVGSVTRELEVREDCKVRTHSISSVHHTTRSGPALQVAWCNNLAVST